MGRRPCAATYAAASAGGWLVAAAVKEIVARPRPLGAGIDAIVRGTAASGFGFISGHTTVAFAGATVIWVFYGRRWGLAAYLVATMVGIAAYTLALTCHSTSSAELRPGQSWAVGDVGRAADSLTPLEASQQHQSH